MTNLFHDSKNILASFYSMFVKKRGAATLIFTIVLLVMSTLIIIFAANFARMQSKITANFNRNAQSFEAAQAGLEFGINYLQQMSGTILANNSGGFLLPYTDTNTSNVVLANGSKYSFVYSNPIENNYNLILITSTGTSQDGSGTRVVSQLVQFGSLIATQPTLPLVTKGSVTLAGNASVNNSQGVTTIQSASTVELSGSATTSINTGQSSDAHITAPDIQQNIQSLQNMSPNDFFATYFGSTSTASVQTKVAHYYNNSSSTNYSDTLNGMTGTSIWIDQTNGSTASITGNTTIGSAANPVLMVINGDVSFSGNIKIYGFIFVLGSAGITTTLTGNTEIIGGMAGTDQINMNGNVNLNFDASVLNNLRSQPGISFYAKIPGSWKDF